MVCVCLSVCWVLGHDSIQYASVLVGGVCVCVCVCVGVGVWGDEGEGKICCRKTLDLIVGLGCD